MRRVLHIPIGKTVLEIYKIHCSFSFLIVKFGRNIGVGKLLLSETVTSSFGLVVHCGEQMKSK